MKNIDAHIKSIKHKNRRHSSVDSSMTSEISSDSDNDAFPLAKVSNIQEEITLSSSCGSPSPQIRKSKKRKRCRHKHRQVIEEEESHDDSDNESQRLRDQHHTHKRHHKRKEVERYPRRRHEGEVKVKIKLEPIDDRSSRHPHSSHRRQPEDRTRVKLEQDQHSNQSSRNRHYREGRNNDHARHHRRREEGEPSHERDNRERRSGGESRRNYTRNNRSNRRDEESANRPIKQEQVSDAEPEFEWGKKSEGPNDKKQVPVGDKDKPNFGLSGKLVEDTNMFNGVVIKYSEPPEARKPKRRWRFYPFKGDQGLPTLYIHRQSCFLLGRDRKVADIPTDHPSCSKQHAALQYRLVPFKRDNGTNGRRVRPYIIDLESANGTFVNNVKIEPKKYVELLERDVVKFGYSSREYVLLHEQSKDEELDDDVMLEPEDE